MEAPPFLLPKTMPPTGRTPMTRAEAARHASLVRWKKESPIAPQTGGMANPKIRARVAEILAEKNKAKAPKGAKPKGRGKAKAKPKAKADGRTPQEKANQNRAAVAKQGGMDKLEGTIVRLNAGMNSDLEKDAHEELIKKGLAERGADGKPKLTAAGKKWKAAADKGNTEGAQAALVEGQGRASEKEAKEKAKGEKVAAREKVKAERTAASEAKKQERAKAVAEKKKQAEKKQRKMQQARKKKQAPKQDDTAERAQAALDKWARVRAIQKIGKSLDMEIKQSDEERAMFAKMGGGRGKGKGYNKRKSKLYKNRGEDKPAASGGGGGSSSSSSSASSGGLSGGGSGSSSASTTGRGGGPNGRTTLRAPVSGDMEAHARFVTQKRNAAAARAERRGKAKSNIAKIDAIQKELKKRNIPIARLRELQQQLSDIRSGKAIDMEIKAGARHSRTDMEHLQSIHDSAVACGASCGDDDEEFNDDDTEMAEKAIKGIMDNPQWYAQHECGDIMQAASALTTMAMLIQSELAEEDEDDAHVSMLVDAARTLVKFVSSELDELEGAAGDAADTARMGPMNKAVEDDTWLHIDGGELKAADDDTITGLAVLYATKATHDLERDYYDKDTDLWLNHWGWPRPITYHHGMDQSTRDDPVVGHWTKATVTDEGVWLEGQLDRAHRYYKAIKELARRGYLKISSDSGPQWVIREPQSNGANYIKRWPLVTASVTVTPMEPRMLPVEVKAFLAEIGYEAIDDSPEAIDPDSVEADGRKADDSERARRLLLELELLQLEETAQ